MNPALSKALAIFLEELKKHLDWFDATILPAIDAEDLEVFNREAKGLAHRLHQIRGGAGFLELDQLASEVKTCEELLKMSAHQKLARKMQTLAALMRSEYERCRVN